MPNIGGGDLFSDLLKPKGTEQFTSLTSADNSLSRALFCLQTILSTAWTVGGCAAVGTYGVVVSAENAQLVRRYRGMRWMVRSSHPTMPPGALTTQTRTRTRTRTRRHWLRR